MSRVFLLMLKNLRNIFFYSIKNEQDERHLENSTRSTYKPATFLGLALEAVTFSLRNTVKKLEPCKQNRQCHKDPSNLIRGACCFGEIQRATWQLRS
jgi:hypothetical protein